MPCSGGETVHALGYGYLFSPVLLNVMVLLAVAVVFNYPFAWRRYPQMLASPLAERRRDGRRKA